MTNFSKRNKRIYVDICKYLSFTLGINVNDLLDEKKKKFKMYVAIFKNLPLKDIYGISTPLF